METSRDNEQLNIAEEQMERNLDRINMWIGNCDQKTSFILALIGIVLTILLTSNAVQLVKEVLVNPFLNYWKYDIGEFDLYRFLIALLLIIGLILCFYSIRYFLHCLHPNTNYTALRKEGMEEKSLLYFGTIAKMEYSDFCQTRNNRYNDLSSQVYVNSIICAEKFKNYEKGLCMVKYALPLLAIAFLLILFI